MNDLDREIRRAFDELVNAAPPPPCVPSYPLLNSSGKGPSGRRTLVMAASILLIVAVGVAVLAHRDSADDTLTTLDDPQPTPAPTTSAPARSAPTTTAERPVESRPSTVPTSTVEPVAGLYEVVVGQPMPRTTAPIPASGEAYDGIYFAYLNEEAPPEDPQLLRFDALQAFSGVDCATRFGADAPNVCTPIGIDINGPTARVDMAVANVPVSVRDLNSDASYRIPGQELISLISGATPAPSAPTGFAFSGGFGFLLTYEAGTLTRIDQPAAPD